MEVFVFDLLPYKEHVHHLRVNGELPWPLGKQYFNPDVAVASYAEHLDAWEEMDRLGYDGVAFNEHHTSPYGLMNSPNLLAAAAAMRTKRLKLAMYGNALPLHDPLRLAEELSVLDCLSNGRIISGVVRGIPREYRVYNVNPKESRDRFEEAWDIIQHAWMDEVLNYEGQFWTYRDAAIWPRPVQRPHPDVWVPVTSSKETIEWAGKHNFKITPGGTNHRGAREDIIRYFAKQLERNGHQITPNHLVISLDVYVADSKEQAFQEAGPYWHYFYTTLFSHGNITETKLQSQIHYVSSSAHNYLRPENRAAVAGEREDYRGITMEKLRARIVNWPWGSPEEVRDRIIETMDQAGANILLINMNRGAMPHDMYLNQIRRFAKEVLPALQAHNVTTVNALESVTGE
jgi:alkanesulfonate monooxygenase SsuD/methylene tetrahydromethanopterin reductase-like flavin-dependent oxidoreductase (luciferase family)